MKQRFDLEDGTFSLGQIVEEIRQELPECVFLSHIPIVDVNNKPIQTAVLIESTDKDGKPAYKLMLY